jgi:hypothetical protein
MGDPAGVAREAAKPEVVSLSGKVVEVETGPCEMSTGRASIGTHFLLETKKGETLNVHLGPAPAVGFIADQLQPGENVSVEAFRTERMPDKHYAAKSLKLAGKTTRLRDDAFRPFWLQGPGYGAGRGAVPAGAETAPATGPRPGAAAPPAWGACPRYGWGPGQGRGPGFGRGPGRGCGAAYGRGPGWGRGAGYGRGAGWDRGAGYGRGAAGPQAGAYGWGRGQAAGRGYGWGRGWAFQDEDRDGVCDYYESVRGAQ